MQTWAGSAAGGSGGGRSSQGFATKRRFILAVKKQKRGVTPVVRLRLAGELRERYQALARAESEKHGVKFTTSDMIRRALEQWLQMRGLEKAS